MSSHHRHSLGICQKNTFLEMKLLLILVVSAISIDHGPFGAYHSQGLGFFPCEDLAGSDKFCRKRCDTTEKCTQRTRCVRRCAKTCKLCHTAADPTSPACPPPTECPPTPTCPPTASSPSTTTTTSPSTSTCPPTPTCPPSTTCPTSPTCPPATTCSPIPTSPTCPTCPPPPTCPPRPTSPTTTTCPPATTCPPTPCPTCSTCPPTSTCPPCPTCPPTPTCPPAPTCPPTPIFPPTSTCPPTPTCPSTPSTTTTTTTTASPENGKLIMVIGGSAARNTRDWVDDIEIVSTDPGTTPVPYCLRELNPFPLGTIYYGAGALTAPDGVPLVCGGCIGRSGSSSCRHSDSCHRYEPETDSWKKTGTMSGWKSGVASDYSDSFGGLVMAHHGDPLEAGIARIAITKDGTRFEELAAYPNPEVIASDAGCLVAVDNRRLFLAGGFPGSRRAYMYSRDGDSWRELESMRVGRQDHSCGLVDTFRDGKKSGTGKEVIVAGGSSRSSRTSVEIFSLDTETWRIGNILPYWVYGAYSVHHSESFILVGGAGSAGYRDGYRDTMLKYQPQNDTWSELPGKMKRGRSNAIAIVLDMDIFPACP